jgi:hypothetical protein
MRHSISLALQTIIFFGVVLPMRAQEGRTLPWQREIPLHGLPETSQPDAVTRYSIVGKMPA